SPTGGAAADSGAGPWSRDSASAGASSACCTGSGSSAAGSTDGGASSCASVSLGSWGVPLSINQLRNSRPNDVEPIENCGRHDGHCDHNQRRRSNFLGVRPSDLLQLGSDLVSEGEVLVAAIHHDADDRGPGGGDQRDLEVARACREVAPDPVDRPLQQIEQND